MISFECCVSGCTNEMARAKDDFNEKLQHSNRRLVDKSLSHPPLAIVQSIFLLMHPRNGSFHVDSSVDFRLTLNLFDDVQSEEKTTKTISAV